MDKVKLKLSTETYETFYQTPEGKMNQQEYLIWLNGMLKEIKNSLLSSLSYTL